MPINNIQERVERSLFEVIRLKMVEWQLIPDIADDINYPKDGNGDLTEQGQLNWEAAMQAAPPEGFWIEIFSNSSPYAKGLKKVPRIVLNSQRIIPGEIGLNPGGTTNRNPLDPDNYIVTTNPLESGNLQIDMHLVSANTKQTRVLNMVLQAALGQKGYKPMHDNIAERFFFKQFNHYNLPDPPEGILEEIYSYEVQDLYIFDDAPSNIRVVSPIKEITQETLIKNEVIDQQIILPIV